MQRVRGHADEQGRAYDVSIGDARVNGKQGRSASALISTLAVFLFHVHRKEVVQFHSDK
jgi:hypothetical protein